MIIQRNVKITNNFTAVQNATTAQLATALYAVAEEIMTDTKANYVPVITGNLRNSGFVQKPTIVGTRVSVNLGFGGPSAVYALRVHEYPKGYGQGKSKYLTNAINTWMPTIPARMAQHLSSWILSGGRRGNP